MRFEKSEINGIQIINDYYNANPNSMIDSLLVLDNLKINNKSKKIIILGDMLELGESSEKEHRNIAKFLVKINIDMIFLYGKESWFVFDELKKIKITKKIIFHSLSKTEISNEIIKFIKPSDLLFLKGSRGMKLEEIIEKLKV